MDVEADDSQSHNYALFRDCLSTTLLGSSVSAGASGTNPAAPKRRRRAKSSATAATSTPALNPERDAEELADFIDYLTSEVFESLPEGVQHANHRDWRESEKLQQQFPVPLTTDNLGALSLPPNISETLITYGLISPDPTMDSLLPATTEDFLLPVLAAYIGSATVAPPASQASRADACEICERSWIPLSYHHLIPRFVHDKAVKRGWHRKEDLQNVAWLCGACHRFVHRFKSHEELARDYYTIELLMEEDEVQRWAEWVGRLRWKGGGVRKKRK